MSAAMLSRPSTPQPRAGLAWPAELFVLAEANREALIARAESLAEFVRNQTNLTLSYLSHTLVEELVQADVRLAIIAENGSDLVAKLGRAVARLRDPGCTQIRDTSGIYYFDEPLYHLGGVALLAPGEGAQYLGMHRELREQFPDVAEVFEWCDTAAKEAGEPERSLDRLLFIAPEASAAEMACAEDQLHQLGNSIFSVLIADIAAERLLAKFGLPVSACAGHSAGELAALVWTGSLDAEPSLGFSLLDAMDLLQEQENSSDADAVLLAVGAGKSAITNLIGPTVTVAMDNCPHQCVVVGPADAMNAAEAAIKESGLVCERLPFHRPYHTPLFSPWMGPLEDFFGTLTFCAPRIPVYSATTARPFPSSPDDICRLTVNHWRSPVEFTKTIENMYADGTRIFVEAGPRGNLSAFAADILRGKPFAALPLDVPRRGGLTQLLHCLGQLFAHHVPLELGHLFANRDAQQISWRAPKAAYSDAPFELPSDDQTAVMLNYLSVMEQFLDVQREVHEAYFSADGAPGATAEPWTGFEFGSSEHARVATALPRFAMLGDVIHFVPGQALVTRRKLDLAEDLFALDHTLGGRNASRCDPNQHGLPVLPMTFSLEIMAECASALIPGKVVSVIENIRLHRWLPYTGTTLTLETRAEVVAPASIKVTIIDRDADKPASEAILHMADAYPDAPTLSAFSLTNESCCRTTPEILYRNLFHGPRFQGIRSSDRWGVEGIEGSVEVLPRSNWFASSPDPELVFDPVLIDMAMHILGAWHLEQPDWTGRILLPFEVRQVEFFGPTPPVGTVLQIRGHNEQASARHFRHGVEMAYPDGQLWCRLTGAGYWRFYLPFGHVNFFGPKDEYFLSRHLPDAVPAPASRVMYLEIPVDLKEPVLRSAGARVTLTARELDLYSRFEGTDDALNAWMFGRIVAKDAVRSLWAEKTNERIFPADMEIDGDSVGRVGARPRDPAGAGELSPASVAYFNGRVAAIACEQPFFGIGLAATEIEAARAAIVSALGEEASDSEISVIGSHAIAILKPGVQSARPDLPARVQLRMTHMDGVVIATTICEAAP
ncbi:MAG: acyltransferase domain-containing protein [Gemmataceae bacterium]